MQQKDYSIINYAHVGQNFPTFTSKEKAIDYLTNYLNYKEYYVGSNNVIYVNSEPRY